MEEIFKQYGGPIITALVVVAIVAIVGILLTTTGAGGVILNAFEDLISQFQGQASHAINAMDNEITTTASGTIMIM